MTAPTINGLPPGPQDIADFKQAFALGDQFTSQEVALLRALIQTSPGPTINTLPLLAASMVGQPVTWSAGTATGASSILYSLRNSAGVELGTVSGGYTPTAAAAQLTVYMTAVAANGQSTQGQSNTVTVSAAPVVAPVITLAPVLAAAKVGTAVTWSAGTATNASSIVYSLRNSAGTELSKVSGSYIPTAGGGQISVFMIATGSTGLTTQAQSNSVTIAAAAADPYMIASHRAKFAYGGTQYSASTFLVSAVVHYAPPYEIKSPRALFAGYFISGTTNAENNFGNALDYTGAWIEVDGVRKRLTVNGSNTFSVPVGANVFTDPDDSIVIPAGKPYRLIVTMTGDTGRDRPSNVPQNFPFGSRAGGLNDSFQTGTSDFASIVDSGAVIPGGNNNFGKYALPGASMIVAKGWAAGGKRPVVLITGSSSAEGVNDDKGTQLKPPDGVWGAIARAFADSSTSEFIPNLNLGRTGVVLSTYNATTMAKRVAALAAVDYPFTTILSDLGRNDSGSTVVGNYPAYATFMRTLKPSGAPDRKFIQTTLMSSYSTATTANIGFTTVANQQARNGTPTAMQSLNPLVRSNSLAGVDDWIEQTGITDANRMVDDWAWKPGTQTTVAAAYAANATTIVLTAAPEIGERLAINAGTANYSAQAFPTAVAANTPSTGQFTVSLRLEGGTNAAAVGDPVQGVGTEDGIHGDTLWALKTAPVFVAAKPKLVNSLMQS